MAETTFPLFALLPPELRDTIWELCLPHRILELDLPSPDYIFNTRYLYSVTPSMGDNDDEDDNNTEEEPPSLDYARGSCILKHTTHANSAAPLIARVCRESRAVAFRCGGFLRGAVLNKDVPPNHLLINTRYTPVPQFWFDRTRDKLHLHWQPFGYMADDTQLNISPDTAPLGNYISLLRQLYDNDSTTIINRNNNNQNSGGPRHQPAIASLSDDLLDVYGSFGDKQIIRHIASRKEWLVCGAVVVIHVHPSHLQTALAQSPSGLWGLLGDERIVCVDAFDTATLRRYREFWRIHGSRPETGDGDGDGDGEEEERLAAAFFRLCDVLGGEEKEAIVHCNELPRNFVEDLTVRWLLHAPIWAPEENGGIGSISSNNHSHLDPNDRKDIWLHTPVDGFTEPLRQSEYEVAEPFARQMWKPDTSHPWVKNKLDRMPVFRPTVMFRLCTNDCMGNC